MIGAWILALAVGASAVAAGDSSDASAQVTVIVARDHPFTALPAPDGATLFISVVRERSANGILVVHRENGSYRIGGFVPVDGRPTGLAMTPDGRTLLVAGQDRYAALSAVAAARDEVPHVTYFQNHSVDGAIEVMPSADGAYAFFANENDDSIGVVKLGAAANGDATLAFVGRIPTDHLPVGMALSPDGSRLYVTSEVGAGRPQSCAGGRRAGTIAVVDVATATTNADRAIVSTATAGCGAVRVAASPDGKVVWATLRGENALAAFDAAALVKDPDRALLRKVRVGTAPVGLTLVRNGALAFVANSNRFDRQATNSTVDVIDTAAALSGGSAIVRSYPTGAFPRELREAPQHDGVYLTNYDGGTVEVLPVP